ncbi:hypothetical protein BCR41DRAFT_18898 [Lobosporangium transversale]|uniref:MIT domain-containing protein n=1 Tax=Lobosporangium transversale TaxID=64571 RepID=A0A1Y2G097_9FUNG|nr:hypothetical protein BCR41DRAFT_18898 [Lobosporangium transversale]ORY90052.1 hypothetical protein BCR41DRAFT_18898 [Lobosporangium transversale]|eukprot:XP_021875088.1 hypothetical protein BCR41DRAFT_18898 [Lobosporangium transversale]
MSFVDDVMESSIRSKHTSTPPLHSSYQRVDSFEPQNNQSPRVVAEETPVVGGGVTGVTEAEGSTTGGTNKQTSHRSKHESAPAPPKGIAALGNRPRSSSSTKALLTMALLEAQSAVQKDNDGNISEALDSYSKAVTLLGKVMEAASTQDERERLKIIHDSYRFRMHLLATPPSLPTQQSVITPETNNERQSEGAMETQVVQSTLGTETAQNVQESRKIQSNDEEKPQATAPVEEYTKSTPPPRPPPPPPGSLDLPLSLKEALKEQGVTFDDPSPPLRPPTLGLPPLPMSPPPIPPRNPPPPPPRSPPPLASILGPAPLPPQSVAASASTSTIRSHAQATSVQMHAMPLNAMASVENTGASTTTAMTAISGGISQIAMVRKDAPPKQTKKNRAVSHGPPAAAPAPPTGEPKTRRLRAESASVGLSGTNNFSKLENTSNENGSSLARNRYRTKTFAGVPRTAQTDLEHQPQPQAHPSPTLPSQQQPQQQQLQQRRVRDKEQKPKFVILKSAPTVPLPPPPPRTSGPTTEPLQAADSTSAQSRDVSAMHAMPMSPLMSPPMSPPVPQVPPLRPNRVSAASKFTKSGTPTLTAAHMTFSSMGDGSNNGRPLSPPPTSPPPIIPVSPPLSPTNPGRRIRPLYQQLMPQPPIKSPEQQQQQQQQLPESQAEVQEQKQDGKEQKGQVEGLATLHEDEREESHSSESSSSHRISHSSASSVEKEASLTINSTMANQTQSTTKKGLESSANASADPDTLVEVWLPNLLNTSFATSKIFLDHLEQPSDSTPQDQVFLKGWYKSTQHGQEDIPPVPSMPPVPPLPAGYSQQSPEMQSVEQMQSPTTSTLPTSSTITTKASPLALSLESQQLLDTLSRATANAMAALESHSGAATTKPATRTQEAISPKLLPSRTISATTTATKIMDSNSSNSSNSDSNNNNNSPINANLKPNGSGSGNCQNNADTNTNSNNNSKGSSSNNQNSPTIAAPATMATTNNTGTGRELSLQDVISQDPFAGLKTNKP